MIIYAKLDEFVELPMSATLKPGCKHKNGILRKCDEINLQAVFRVDITGISFYFI